MDLSQYTVDNSLEVCNTQVNVEKLVNFLQDRAESITSLSLSGCHIGDEGVKALADKLSKSITSLNLSGNNIGAEGAEALAGKLPESITSLNLSHNFIGAEGAEALAGKLPKSITSLDLSLNDIGDKGVEALAGKLPKSITSLDLSFNRIGDKGAKALAGKLPKSITSLDLSFNRIGDKGAKALAGKLPKSITSLDLSFNRIGDKGAKALAGKLPKSITSLNLSFNNIRVEGIEGLAQLKSTAIYLGGPVDQFCRGLMQSYDEGKDGRLENRDLTKGLVFYFARYDDKQNVEYLLTHPEKYPFLINSRDEEQHALSYFCTRFPEMQKLLFEHGLIPERERGDDARTLRGSQSVHARPIVKRADFFAKKLVESMEASKEQLKQATASYVKSIELLEPYKIGPVRLKLLNLTDNGKRSVMKEALRSWDPVPEDKEFIETIINKAKRALEQQYLKKKLLSGYGRGYSTNRIQYDYTRDDAKMTIPESIGYVKLLIDNSSVPLREKKELLVTLMEQNPELVRKELSMIKEELGNSDIFNEGQFDRTELHGLLSGINDDEKVNKLFKEISGLDIEKVWREQKGFVLLEQIYMAATEYGKNGSACPQGVWSRIINSINEISSEIVAQYDRYLEEEQRQEMQKDTITEENIKLFLEGLANELIRHVKFNPELREALGDFAVCNVDVGNPEKIIFEQQEILAEINKYFSKSIKNVLPNYDRNIPSWDEYNLIITGLSEVGVMQRFVGTSTQAVAGVSSSSLENSNVQGLLLEVSVQQSGLGNSR